MPVLSDLTPFHFGQVRNFFLLVLGQVCSKCNYVFHIGLFECAYCLENSLDPDQLASEASGSRSTLFSIELISVFKKVYICY